MASSPLLAFIMLLLNTELVSGSRAAFLHPDSPSSTRKRPSFHRHVLTAAQPRASNDGTIKANGYEKDTDYDKRSTQQQHLVLVGGGHAHVQVIKALNSVARPEHLKVTLIDATKAASYSGMVPGSIASMYTPKETLIELEPLAEWAGLEFVHDRVVDVDLDRKLVYTRNDFDNPIPFDAISIDIGSTSRGLDETPGARKYTIPTRPIDRLVKRLDRAREEVQDDASSASSSSEEPNRPKVVVIGAGAAGVELSMAITSRWQKDGLNPETTLLDAGDQLLPNESNAARAKLKDIMDSKHIQVLHGCVVQEVCEDQVVLKSGERIPFTHCVWATGAGAHPVAFQLGQRRGLKTTKHGWIEVGPTLQSKSHPFVFAAGDCASIENLSGPSPPKAGVFAVRAGPILIENLTRFLNNDPLIEYQPQDDFLKLLACGDGKALGFRFGLPLFGKWVWEMKDHIDSGFMDLFRVDPAKKPDETYNTAQYDEKDVETMHNQHVEDKMDAQQAAAYIQREDDDVDYLQAWSILRAMSEHPEFRDAVLSYITEQKQTAQTAQIVSTNRTFA